jgi:hypothetical protein
MRIRAVLGLLAAGCMLAACSSSTGGTGGGSGTPSPTRSPTPATTLTHLPSSSAAVSSAAAPSSAVPPSSSGAPPVAVQDPTACAAGACTKIASGDLGAGYAATVYSGPSPSGQVGAEYLQLTLAGVSVFWKVTDGYNPGQLACSPIPSPNCVVEDSFGAHASSARGLIRLGNKLVQFDEAPSDTPVTDVLDLNGDGWIDVRSMQNTYDPDYATGKVYWLTALSDGTKFAVTGCTPPKKAPGPKPTAPVSGTCAS